MIPGIVNVPRILTSGELTLLPNFGMDIKTSADQQHDTEVRLTNRISIWSLGFEAMSTQHSSDVPRDSNESNDDSPEEAASLPISDLVSVSPAQGIPAPKSIHTAALEEANRHKWIESQKHGRDLGETALREWYRLHWYDYCRNCHLQHLDGKQPWQEFDAQIFGHLLELMKSKDVLLERILDRVCEGQENLEIVQWALEYSLPMDRVIRILEQLNVNSARFEPQMAIA